MDREKFQQKALKQTKQKISKSAEFLMVKEDRGVSEGFGNPAFNLSSPDLLAHQTSDKKVIRCDTLDRTLAAPQQKSGLLASAEPKGNEYSRNYFDPLMDEEINPRQCGMEVSREAPLQVDNRNLSDQLMRLVEKSGRGEAQDGSLQEEILDSEETVSSRKRPEPHKEGSKASERSIQKNTILLGTSSLEQDLKCEGEGLSQYIPMACLNTDKTFDKVPGQPLFADLEASKEHRPARLCTLTDGTHESKGAAGPHSKALPTKKDVKPGMAFLFELCLLRGKYACFECVVGWAAFPLCDNNFNVMEGKFKCPLLRGHYDQKFDSFRKMEDLMCLDLDHWLCNLYFEVMKLPLSLDDQTTQERQTLLPPEFPVALMAGAQTEESGMENMAGPSEKQTQETICASLDGQAKSSLRSAQGSISHKICPCPMDCDLNLLKEDHELHKKRESLIDHSVKQKSAAWRTGEIEDYSEDVSYLEELEQHRFSVCCSSGANGTGSREFFKHLHFGLMMLFSELQLAEWRSQSFWYIILLIASLWFLRFYLHYLSQWLFLQAISTPVTKFHFPPFTVELCYPPSSLHIREELLVVVVGPLMLNAVILPLFLIRRGCQLLFASPPDVLSKLIITMGLWTVLDPLAVFIVDAVLGRLTRNGDPPVADAAKLYWVFVRTMQLGILGVMLTVLVYILLFVMSSLVLYLYCLRLHNDSWILDVFQRIHSEEIKFFIPYDLEISNQELSNIVKRSKQWRGINGNRRKVAVYDYIWKNHGFKSRISSCDLQKQNEISVSALGPGDITSHVSIYTVYPSGFRELHRHFLRLPSGALVEVFGDISGLRFIPTEVATAIQGHINEMDSTSEDSIDIKSREMKRIH